MSNEEILEETWDSKEMDLQMSITLNPNISLLLKAMQVAREDERLYTLKEIKQMFKFHSDYSTQCNGYESLCKIIKTMEEKS